MKENEVSLILKEEIFLYESVMEQKLEKSIHEV